MSKKEHFKYIIIGAGLSGLTTAYALQKAGESNFVILESRDRIGGRILSQNGIDFGATWFQNHHEHIANLLTNLNLDRFHQYTKGKSVLVYNSMSPAHYFESDPNAPSAYRVAGSSSAMINALYASFSEKVILNTVVTEIHKTQSGIKVITENSAFEAEKVICTIPPRVATRILFQPQLPEATREAMKTTHTWMSNAIKVGIRFKNAFWRENGFSGTLIGQIGPVTELYDHTSNDASTYTLMGFVNEGLRELSPKDRKERILNYIATYLGEEVRNYSSYQEKDWSVDSHTSCNNLHSVYLSPQYGKAEFQQSYLNNTLLFSGAETSTHQGGYMEGAVYSGLLVAQKLLQDN